MREQERQRHANETMAIIFMFDIGDLVYIRGSMHSRSSTPKQFVVCERILQQCHGGTQRVYKLLNYEGWVPEIAITPAMPAYEWGDKNRSLEECQHQRDSETVRLNVHDDHVEKRIKERNDREKSKAEDITE